MNDCIDQRYLFTHRTVCQLCRNNGARSEIGHVDFFGHYQIGRLYRLHEVVRAESKHNSQQVDISQQLV